MDLVVDVDGTGVPVKRRYSGASAVAVQRLMALRTTMDGLEAELAATVPLSVTMAESLARLR